MKCKNKKVAVLLAAFNGSSYIEEQIQSIINQVDINLDIFVSLDLSTDSTLDLLLGLQERHTNITILDYGKKYGNAGQNFFHLIMTVDFSDYNYVAFADQDDIWKNNKLTKAIFEIESRDVDAYSSNVEAFWENGTKKLIKKSSPQCEFDYLFESAGPGCTFVMNNMIALDIKSFLLKRKQSVSDIWLHDWFCYAFARSKGFTWYIDHNSYMLYRQHSSNSVGANTGLQSLIKRARSVMSGDAFDKVVAQAEILNLAKSKPIYLIKRKSFFSLLKLLALSNKCRRRNKDKVVFFIAVLLFSLNRLSKCQK